MEQTEKFTFFLCEMTSDRCQFYLSSQDRIIQTVATMKVEIVRPYAYFDISVGDNNLGRVVVELFDDLAPKAVENFLSLCKGTKDAGFKDTYFHRVIKNFMIQGGDTTYGQAAGSYPNPDIGKGGYCVFGAPFEDENLADIDKPFLLCMANSGPNTNKSQFFISTYTLSHLNGKHTVFGKVVHGKSIIREVEAVNTDSNNVPVKEEKVVIHGCGEWSEGDEVPIYNASYDQIGGDIYEEYPDDDEHINKESSESVFEAASKIKDSGGLLFKKGEKQQAFLKYKKCLRYVMEYFPDPDDEPQWFAKYQDLKKKLYLNLSLVCLQLKNYKKCIDYSEYLIDMKSLLNKQELAKANFRKGSGLVQMKRYKEALGHLVEAQGLIPEDKVIAKEVENCQRLIDQQKKNEKAKYAKFFS